MKKPMYRKSYFELQLFTLLTRNEAADSNTFFNKCPGYLFLSHLSIREYLRKLDSFFNHSLSVKFKYFDLKLRSRVGNSWMVVFPLK